MGGAVLEGRDDVLRQACEHLTSGRSVLLVGVAGVGKSHLAAAVAERLAGDSFEVARVMGSAAGTSLPYAAIAPLLPAEGADAGAPMLVVLRRTLAERAAGRTVLLLVDDAQHLDSASALLVQQLVGLGEARAIVTQRRGTPLPDPIARTLHDEPVARIELEPLDRAGTDALAAGLAGAPLDPASARRLWELTEGNPLFVREVLVAASEAGGPVVIGPGTVRSPRLADLVRQRLSHLDDAARDGLLHVALGEPVGPGELRGIVDADVLARLEAAHLVTSTLDQRRLVIRLAHPLYGEVLRAAAPATQLRAAHLRLAEALQATGARRRSDRVRLATWALDGGLEVDPPLLVAAASAAHGSHDHEATIRLAQAALERSPDFAVGELLFDALYELGDVQVLEDHLAAWEPLATEPDQRLSAALARGVTTYWRVGDLERALVGLDGAAAEQGSTRREEALGVAGTLLAFSGRADDALALATPLLDRGPDRVLVQAALSAGQALRCALRPEEALAVADRALDAYRALGAQVLLVPMLVLGSARSGALADCGRYEDALEVARSGATAARETGDLGSLALAALSEAWVLFEQGRPASMVEVVTVADQIWADSHHWGMRRWSLAASALGHALMGDAEGARAELRAFDAGPLHPAQVFHGTEVRARAWLAWLDGRLDDAHALLRAGADTCAATADHHGEASCLYDLARLDRPEEAAGRLAELAAAAEGPRWAAIALDAAARAAGDAQLLGASADRLADLGAWLWAAEAANAAADAHRRRGAQREAATWARRADDCRGRCETVRSPGLVVASGPEPLSRREREVAVLAAQGLASRVIGERLFVGTRTVESHLARVYAKLGIRSRAELARLFGGEGPEPPTEPG